MKIPLNRLLSVGLLFLAFVFEVQSQKDTTQVVSIYLPNTTSFIKYSYALIPENTIIHNPRFVTKLNQEEHQYDFTPYSHKNQLSVYNVKSFYRFLSKEIYRHLGKVDPYSDSIKYEGLILLASLSKDLGRQMKYLEDTIYFKFQEHNRVFLKYKKKGYLNDNILSAFKDFNEMKNQCKPSIDKTKFNVFLGIPRRKEMIIIGEKSYNLKISRSDEIEKISKKNVITKIKLNGVFVYINESKNIVYLVK